MKLQPLLGCALISFIPIAFALTGPEIAAYLKKILSPGTDFYLPTDSNYTAETTQRWNAYGAPTYVVSVKPALEGDVQKIMQYARQNKVPFLGTGGGHGYTTSLASIQDGIEIDLGHFNGVAINGSANTMTVGGSVHFHNITGPLYAAGKEFQVGSCSCVGILGATLGGGIGPYGGLHGLQLDALESVKMVTGAGDLITVSATENPDLFWGLRGAGMNYGIVTSATYTIYDFTNNGQAMNADIRIAINQNGSFWTIVKSFVGNQPDPLTLDFAIAYDEEFGGTYILLNVIYVGPLSEGMTLIQPFLDLKPFSQNITMLPWSDLETQSKFAIDAASCVKGREHSVYSLNLYDIDVSTLMDVTNYMNTTYTEEPALGFAILALVLYAPRVVQSVPDNATAYPYRNTLSYAHFDVGFPNATYQSAADTFGKTVRSKLLKTSGVSSIEVYVNYAHGDEGQDAWYAPRKLPELLALKKKYDPDMLFNHFNGLA